MDLEIRHLRVFVAVAESRSYTAASRLLLISQPALTRTVQQLEQRLEVRLLERSSRSMELSDAGEVFLRRAKAILRDLDVAVAEARDERTVRIGFSWVLPDPWVADAIVAFEETTGASAQLMRRDDLSAALACGDVDIALTRYPIARANATTLTLFQEPRVAAVSRRWPLGDRESISWNELATHPVVINTVSGSTRPEMWDEAHRPTEVIECANYDEWTTLVAAGRGVGSIGRSAAEASTHSGIAILSIADAPPTGLWLSHLPGRSRPLLRRLVDAVTAQNSGLLPDTTGFSVEQPSRGTRER